MTVLSWMKKLALVFVICMSLFDISILGCCTLLESCLWMTLWHSFWIYSNIACIWARNFCFSHIYCQKFVWIWLYIWASAWCICFTQSVVLNLADGFLVIPSTYCEYSSGGSSALLLWTLPTHLFQCHWGFLADPPSPTAVAPYPTCSRNFRKGISQPSKNILKILMHSKGHKINFIMSTLISTVNVFGDLFQFYLDKEMRMRKTFTSQKQKPWPPSFFFHCLSTHRNVKSVHVKFYQISLPPKMHWNPCEMSAAASLVVIVLLSSIMHACLSKQCIAYNHSLS